MPDLKSIVDIAVASSDPETRSVLRDQVQVSMVRAAVNVMSEEHADHVNWIARRGLAAQIVTAPSQWLDQFILAVVSGGIIDGQSSDADVEFTVNSLFDPFADALYELRNPSRPE